MKIVGGQETKNVKRVRTAILASGSGTNFDAIVRANKQNKINLEIVVLICNQEHAEVINRAKNHGIDAMLLSHSDYESRLQFDMALSNTLTSLGIELVILAGWMRLLTAEFLERHDNVLNIHPSILPAFRGLGAIKKAYDAQVSETGCTVHRVVPEMDAGPIIAQAFVETEGLDLDQLEQRVHEAEHVLYPRAIAFFVDEMK